MKLFVISLLLVSVSLAFAEEIKVQKLCESYSKISASSDLSKLQGNWSEIAKYGQKENCTTDEIVYVNNTNEYNLIHRNGTNSSQNITYTLRDKNETIISNVTNVNSTIKILEIDNGMYVIWSCMNISNISSSQSLIILSKNKNTKGYEKFLNDTELNEDLSQINHSPEICNKTKSSGVLNIASLSILILTLTFSVFQTITSNYEPRISCNSKREKMYRSLSPKQHLLLSHMVLRK